jgi:hypothetical protein
MTRVGKWNIYSHAITTFEIMNIAERGRNKSGANNVLVVYALSGFINKMQFLTAFYLCVSHFFASSAGGWEARWASSSEVL